MTHKNCQGWFFWLRLSDDKALKLDHNKVLALFCTNCLASGAAQNVWLMTAVEMPCTWYTPLFIDAADVEKPKEETKDRRVACMQSCYQSKSSHRLGCKSACCFSGPICESPCVLWVFEPVGSAPYPQKSALIQIQITSPSHHFAATCGSALFPAFLLILMKKRCPHLACGAWFGKNARRWCSWRSMCESCSKATISYWVWFLSVVGGLKFPKLFTC